MDKNDASDAFAACFRVSDAESRRLDDSLAALHLADAQQLLEEFVHGGIFVQTD